MKLPTNLKPLCLAVEGCEVRVSEVSPILGDIRVSGYIAGPNRPAVFKACELLAEFMSRKSIGACVRADNETDAIKYAPFSFDVPRGWHRDFPRKLNEEESMAEVLKELRQAARHFK